MSEGSQPAGSDAADQIKARAVKDDAFRRDLIADPKGTIEREFGYSIPDSIELRVHEDSTSVVNIVLPPAPRSGEELSERELEAVWGGTSDSDTWSQCTMGAC
jgi:Nitrile hydratase, alpha chain